MFAKPGRFCLKTASRFSYSKGSQFKQNFNYNRAYSTATDQDDSNEDKSRYGQFGRYVPVAGFVLLATYFQFMKTAENCGIVGVVGSDDASGFLLEGLTILRNRGYDSAGIASVSNDGAELYVTKYASRDTTSDSIDLVRAHSAPHIGHGIGIAHTRWATHGGKTDENAHPHFDAKHRVAVVHNGTINNSYDLKKELQAQGIKFTSETDTEVIAQLIGIYLDQGFDTKTAVDHALSRCDGSWGLAVVSKNSPNEIVVACNGSPMVK